MFYVKNISLIIEVCGPKTTAIMILYISFGGRVSMMIVLVYFLCHTPKLCLTFFEIIFEDPKVSIALKDFDFSSSLLLSF